MGEERRRVVVFDTNVLISAFGWNGKPEECLELALSGELEAVASREIIDELRNVLDYPKFEFTHSEKEGFIEVLSAEFDFVNPTASVDRIKEDPDDNKFLECAAAADADYIISGDSHLTALGEHQGTSVLTPEEFLDQS